MIDDKTRDLAERLAAIETACRDFDAGTPGSAREIAEALIGIFEGRDSALARAGGAFASVLSTETKMPADSPDGSWAGLIVWDLDRFATAFEARPKLDGGKAGHRDVSADFWWKSGSIAVRGHHRKVRRRDLAIAAAPGLGVESPGAIGLADGSGWPISYRQGGVARSIIVFGAAEASLRQIGHEVLRSKALGKLVGRP